MIPYTADVLLALLENHNRAVWVDIYVPKDTPAGVHRGKLRVNVDGKPCTLPACNLSRKKT